MPKVTLRRTKMKERMPKWALSQEVQQQAPLGDPAPPTSPRQATRVRVCLTSPTSHRPHPWASMTSQKKTSQPSDLWEKALTNRPPFMACRPSRKEGIHLTGIRTLGKFSSGLPGHIPCYACYVYLNLQQWVNKCAKHISCNACSIHLNLQQWVHSTQVLQWADHSFSLNVSGISTMLVYFQCVWVLQGITSVTVVGMVKGI